MKYEGYVIFNPQTQMFAKGGYSTINRWSKRPKIWRNIGHVKNHLAMYVNRAYNYVDGRQYCKLHISSIYDGCEVVDINTDQTVAKCEDILRLCAEKMADRYGYEIVKD